AEALAIQAWAMTNGGESGEDDLRAALAKLDRAVNIDRTNDQAIYFRGLVHKRLGNVPACFRDFARALSLNPRHVDAEREVRILATREKKGWGEPKLIARILDKLNKKKWAGARPWGARASRPGTARVTAREAQACATFGSACLVTPITRPVWTEP